MVVDEERRKVCPKSEKHEVENQLGKEMNRKKE